LDIADSFRQTLSDDPAGYYGKKILRKVSIVWYYADIRKRALVDCQKSVWGGFMHLNDFGVKVPSGTLFTDFR
jgi:hypothetical protein